MKIKRLKNTLLIAGLSISILVAMTSMLAVSWVIRQQYQKQSNTLLLKASRIITDSLSERKDNLLNISRQLATQKNFGSTIWYLAKYAQSDIGNETLFNSYRQLLKDMYKISRVAKLSQISVYDSSGKLVSFADLENGNEIAGFVERFPSPVFEIAEFKESEELVRQNLHKVDSLTNKRFEFGGQIPDQENVHFSVIDGLLSIESHAPIMGEAFEPASGQLKKKQLGFLVMIQSLDQAYIDKLAHLTDVKINVFHTQGLSRGTLAFYRNPDWGDAQLDLNAQPLPLVLNQININGEDYYQSLIPLYNNKQLVGTIAALHAQDIARKNTQEMIEILGLIAIANLLLIFPLAWYFSISISHPLTILSRIFRNVASGKHRKMLDNQLKKLEQENKRTDELGVLTQSFITMHRAINQKIQQIKDLNASLEEKVELRTRELTQANEELNKLAMYDPLTLLPNRRLLMDRLRLALSASVRSHNYGAVLFLDIDKFKTLNDTLGHDYGDLLLIELARRIKSCVREVDTVARMGGDEFVVLVEEISGIEEEAVQKASLVAEKIRAALASPYQLEDYKYNSSPSIGVCLYCGNAKSIETLIKHADQAMYQAKETGRNAVRFYESAIQS